MTRAGADAFPGIPGLPALSWGAGLYRPDRQSGQPPIDLLDLPKSVLVTYPVVHHHVRSAFGSPR